MNKSKFLELNLPSRDNTDDIADINTISDNFKKIDDAFLDIVEKELPKYQTKDNLINAITDNSSDDNLYPSIPAVSKYTNEKVEPLKIVNSASGNAISLKDSAKDKLKGLKLFGKTTQNGTPTPKAPVPLVSVGDSGSFEVGVYGKNLLNVAQAVTVSKAYAFNNLFIDFGVGDYVFSFTANTTQSAAMQFIIYDDKSEIVLNAYPKTQANVRTEIPFTIKKAGTFHATFFVNVNNATITNCQIEVGTQATSYEPCNKQTLTMPYTLRSDKAGNLKDVTDLARGIYTRKMGCIDLGTLAWEGPFDGQHDFVASFPNNNFVTQKNNVDKPNWINSHYPITTPKEYMTFNTDKVCTHSNTSQRILIYNESYTNVQDLKASLSGVYLVYPLATPIETPLSETELNAYRQLMTNSGNTTILSEAEMEVSYVADTKLYIDNKIAELTALTLEG